VLVLKIPACAAEKPGKHKWLLELHRNYTQHISRRKPNHVLGQPKRPIEPKVAQELHQHVEQGGRSQVPLAQPGQPAHHQTDQHRRLRTVWGQGRQTDQRIPALWRQECIRVQHRKRRLGRSEIKHSNNYPQLVCKHLGPPIRRHLGGGLQVVQSSGPASDQTNDQPPPQRVGRLRHIGHLLESHPHECDYVRLHSVLDRFTLHEVQGKLPI